jgi:hypothetical protein
MNFIPNHVEFSYDRSKSIWIKGGAGLSTVIVALFFRRKN